MLAIPDQKCKRVASSAILLSYPKVKQVSGRPGRKGTAQVWARRNLEEGKGSRAQGEEEYGITPGSHRHEREHLWRVVPREKRVQRAGRRLEEPVARISMMASRHPRREAPDLPRATCACKSAHRPWWWFLIPTGSGRGRTSTTHSRVFGWGFHLRFLRSLRSRLFHESRFAETGVHLRHYTTCQHAGFLS